MSFLLLKYLHLVCIAASFALLSIRGLWLMKAYPLAQEPWVRILPHAVDAILILSAIGMVVMYPSGTGLWGWLSLKLVLIVVYALLVLFTLRIAKTRLPRFLGWFAALSVFLFITSISVLHNPLGILVLF